MSADSRFKRKIYHLLERTSSYCKTINTFFSFPLYYPMIKLFSKKAMEICVEHDIKTVIVVNQPIDAVYAGVIIKEKMPKIKLVTYLLDPIRGNLNNILLSDKEIYRRKVKLENQILEVSDCIIAQLNHYDHYKDSCVDLKNKIKFLGVPLLTNNIFRNDKPKTKEKYMMVYAGAIDNSYRPPDYILNLISLSNKIELKMFLTSGYEYVENFIKDNQIENISVSGPLERDKLVEIYKEADCLLNIGNTMINQMPSKIFEYMSYGKLIISTFRIDEDTSRNVIARYPIGLSLDERDSDLKNVLKKVEDFIEQEHEMVDYEKLKEIFPECLPDSFFNAIKEK